MTDLRLLNGVDADATTNQRPRVSADGGVNVYASFSSLGGGTLNVYECPDQTLTPNQPVYTSTDGSPEHLNVAKGSYLLGELTGATNPSNVVLGAVTIADED